MDTNSCDYQATEATVSVQVTIESGPQAGQTYSLPGTSEGATNAESETPTVVTITTLGRVSIQVDGREIPDQLWDSRKALSLFMFLVDHGRPATTEVINDHLWPDGTASRQSLQTAVSRLRRTFRKFSQETPLPSPVVFSNGTYSINPDYAVNTDVERFVELWEQSRLADSLELYRGEFLPGCSDEWILSRRVTLEKHYLDAAGRLAQELREDGQNGRAESLYRDLIEERPTWEDGYQGLFECLVENGNRDEAVETFQVYRRTMKEQLSLGPSPEMLRGFFELTGHLG